MPTGYIPDDNGYLERQPGQYANSSSAMMGASISNALMGARDEAWGDLTSEQQRLIRQVYQAQGISGWASGMVPPEEGIMIVKQLPTRPNIKNVNPLRNYICDALRYVSQEEEFISATEAMRIPYSF